MPFLSSNRSPVNPNVEWASHIVTAPGKTVYAIIPCVLAACLALTLFVADGFVSRVQGTFKSDGLANAEKTARRLAVELNQTLSQVKQLQEVAAIVTREKRIDSPSYTAIDALDELLKRSSPYILQVGGIGPNGLLQWSTLPLPTNPIDLSAREHFRAIAVDGRSKFTSTPILGAVSGRWTIQMSAGVRAPGGALEGVTVVSVDSAIIQGIGLAIGMQGRDNSAIFRTDGVALSHFDGDTGDTGLPLTANLSRLLTEGHQETQHISNRDEIDRFYSLVPIFGTDVIVAAGLDVDARRGPSNKATLQIQLLSGGLAALEVTLALAVAFGIRRRRRFTAERACHSAVAEANALLRPMFNEDTDVISMYDASLSLRYVNSAITQLFGTETAPAVGTLGFTKVVPEDRPLFAQALADLDCGLHAKRLTFRIRRDDGVIRWVESELIAVSSNIFFAKTDVRYIAVTRDITQRKETEASLEEAHTNLEAMLRGSGGMLYRIRCTPEGDTTVHTFEARGGCQFEFPQKAMNNAAFLPSRLDRKGLISWSKLYETCVAEGQGVVELRMQNGLGVWRWLRIEGYRSENQGTSTELLYFITDVTGEREVRQQTERLALLGEVSAGIAHELNQPLAVIALAAENGRKLLQGGPDGIAKASAKFDRIKHHVARTAKIVAHIRNFGRQDQTARETFEVGDVITDAMLFAESRIKFASVKVIVKSSPEITILHSSRLLLEQMLMNLLLNACDAYADNPSFNDLAIPRIVTISVIASDDYVRITVADSAGGISPDIINDVFKPFVTSKSAGKGTGLGLAFCATAAAQMDGRIDAYNEKDGAVFDIRLPYALGAGLEKFPAPVPVTS